MVKLCVKYAKIMVKSLTGIRGCVHHSQPANMAVTDGNNTKRIQPKTFYAALAVERRR